MTVAEVEAESLPAGGRIRHQLSVPERDANNPGPTMQQQEPRERVERELAELSVR
jgi:hypothetical protein